MYPTSKPFERLCTLTKLLDTGLAAPDADAPYTKHTTQSELVLVRFARQTSFSAQFWFNIYVQ
jgi:hypothetical protein